MTSRPVLLTCLLLSVAVLGVAAVDAESDNHYDEDDWIPEEPVPPEALDEEVNASREYYGISGTTILRFWSNYETTDDPILERENATRGIREATDDGTWGDHNKTTWTRARVNARDIDFRRYPREANTWNQETWEQYSVSKTSGRSVVPNGAETKSKETTELYGGSTTVVEDAHATIAAVQNGSEVYYSDSDGGQWQTYEEGTINVLVDYRPVEPPDKSQSVGNDSYRWEYDLRASQYEETCIVEVVDGTEDCSSDQVIGSETSQSPTKSIEFDRFGTRAYSGRDRDRPSEIRVISNISVTIEETQYKNDEFFDREVVTTAVTVSDSIELDSQSPALAEIQTLRHPDDDTEVYGSLVSGAPDEPLPLAPWAVIEVDSQQVQYSNGSDWHGVTTEWRSMTWQNQDWEDVEERDSEGNTSDYEDVAPIKVATVAIDKPQPVGSRFVEDVERLSTRDVDEKEYPDDTLPENVTPPVRESLFLDQEEGTYRQSKEIQFTYLNRSDTLSDLDGSSYQPPSYEDVSIKDEHGTYEGSFYSSGHAMVFRVNISAEVLESTDDTQTVRVSLTHDSDPYFDPTSHPDSGCSPFEIGYEEGDDVTLKAERGDRLYINGVEYFEETNRDLFRGSDTLEVPETEGPVTVQIERNTWNIGDSPNDECLFPEETTTSTRDYDDGRPDTLLLYFWREMFIILAMVAGLWYVRRQFTILEEL